RGIADPIQTLDDELSVLVREIAGGVHWAEQAGVAHSFAQRRARFTDPVKNFARRSAAPLQLFPIHHASDADLFGRKGDNPEPFIFQPTDDGVAALFAGIKLHTREMPKDGDLLQRWIDLAQTILVAGEIAAATGVDQKFCAKRAESRPLTLSLSPGGGEGAV